MILQPDGVWANVSKMPSVSSVAAQTPTRASGISIDISRHRASVRASEGIVTEGGPNDRAGCGRSIDISRIARAYGR